MFLYIIFIFVLFPYSDLGSLVTSQVAKQTGNQLYIKFDKMNLSLFPTPGFNLDHVLIKSMQFPEIKCEELKVAPSIMGLLSFRPGVSVQASGLMGGDVSLSVHGTSKTKAGSLKQSISIETESIDLSQVANQLNLPMNLDGKINLNAKGIIDPAFTEQPDAELDAKAVRLNITSASIATPLGSLNLPDTKLQELILKGQLHGGELNLEKVQIGTATDELFAQIRGTMNVKIQTYGGNQVAFIPSGYDLSVQIKTKPSYETKAGLFLGFLDQYKKSSSQKGSEYLFKASGSDFYNPPRLTPLNTF